MRARETAGRWQSLRASKPYHACARIEIGYRPLVIALSPQVAGEPQVGSLGHREHLRSNPDLLDVSPVVGRGLQPGDSYSESRDTVPGHGERIGGRSLGLLHPDRREDIQLLAQHDESVRELLARGAEQQLRPLFLPTVPFEKAPEERDLRGVGHGEDKVGHLLVPRLRPFPLPTRLLTVAKESMETNALLNTRSSVKPRCTLVEVSKPIELSSLAHLSIAEASSW